MKILYFSIVAMMFAIGCSKNDNKTPGNNNDPLLTSKKGFGNSNERPEGLPLTLPAGVRIKDGEAHYYAFCWKDTTGDGVPDIIPLPEKWGGFAGGGGVVCFTLINDNPTPAIVKIPPGQILIPVEMRTDLQNHAVMIETEFIVDPQSEQDMYLALFCLNRAKKPAGFDSTGKPLEYLFGPVSQNEELKEITTIIARKKKSDEMFTLAQVAIWEVTEDGGLTEQTRAELKALPDK